MTDLDPSFDIAVVLEFLRSYHEDRDAGTVRSLEAYQRRFPGHEDAIAREYADLQANEHPTAASGETDESDGSGSGPPQAVDSGERASPGSAGTRRDGADRIAPIEGFHIEREIGTGGMGAVYCATQIEPFRRRVALKVVRPDLGGPEIASRFKTERQALALMEHPNVARVYDAGTSGDGRSYFIMEYVEGAPITEYADRKRLDLRERLSLFAQACEGVAHVHAKGFIHRDLKPSNILVAETEAGPVVKVIDFGIAKCVQGDVRATGLRTMYGQVLGSPAYMSPEQAKGTETVDRRSDVYGLGVVLFELLAGELPFDPDTLERLDEEAFWKRLVERTAVTPSRHLGRQSPGEAHEAAERRGLRPEALVRELRGDLDWIVQRATENDPALRYATVGALLEDVRRHLDDLPLPGAGGRALYYARKFARRNRAVLWAGALAVLIAAGTAVGSVVWQRRAAERKARTALEQARALVTGRTSLRETIQELEGEITRLEMETPGYTPVWEMEKLLEQRRELESAREELNEKTALAQTSFRRALDSAPDGPSAKKTSLELRKLLKDLAAEARQWEEMRVGPEYFEVLGSDARPEAAIPPRQRPIRFRLALDPAEAGVWVFRYEELEGRLYPYPFDPAAGVVCGKPELVVSKVYARREQWPGDPERFDLLFPFRRGDVLRTVGGTPIRTLGDLARELAPLETGDAVEITMARTGSTVRQKWIPWSAFMQRFYPYEAGRLVDPFRQLSVEFEPQPLSRTPRNHLAIEDGTCEVDLPPGSYLLLARAEGFAPARYPVASPWPAGERTLELVPETRVPPGFVHIPGGPARVGGDPEVDQSLEPRMVEVESFFLQRTETTFAQYIEFLLALEGEKKLEKDGTIPRQAEWPAGLAAMEKPVKRVAVLPRGGSGPVLSVQDGKVTWAPHPEYDYRQLYLRSPLFGVSLAAALEYARWRTETDGQARWVFDLPGSFEWEKAARGVDRRPYVWGHRFVPSFARIHDARQPGTSSTYDRGGTWPADESVYGIRDLAGSLMEPTVDAVAPGFVAYRGSSWYQPTRYFVRAANRYGYPPTVSPQDAGIRLVARAREP